MILSSDHSIPDTIPYLVVRHDYGANKRKAAAGGQVKGIFYLHTEYLDEALKNLIETREWSHGSYSATPVSHVVDYTAG